MEGGLGLISKKGGLVLKGGTSLKRGGLRPPYTLWRLPRCIVLVFKLLFGPYIKPLALTAWPIIVPIQILKILRVHLPKNIFCCRLGLM